MFVKSCWCLAHAGFDSGKRLSVSNHVRRMPSPVRAASNGATNTILSTAPLAKVRKIMRNVCCTASHLVHVLCTRSPAAALYLRWQQPAERRGGLNRAGRSALPLYCRPSARRIASRLIPQSLLALQSSSNVEALRKCQCPATLPCSPARSLRLLRSLTSSGLRTASLRV